MLPFEHKPNSKQYATLYQVDPWFGPEQKNYRCENALKWHPILNPHGFPLQLKQLQLSWERVPQGIGMCLWEFVTILTEGHLWGHTMMFGGKAWLTVSALLQPKVVLSGWGQDSVQASQVHPHHTLSSMSSWTLLCALVHSHVGTRRGHPKTVPTKLAAWNCPASLGMPKHSEFLSLKLRGRAQLLKNNPKP